MREHLLRLAVALGASAAIACAGTGPRSPTDAQGGRPYVILVSFDAMRHDYLDRYRPAAFAEVAARGVQADALIPSFPSKTFPNHYTLVTGLYPGHHGIVGNAFYDPTRRAWYRLRDRSAVRDSSWYGGEPIWATAERNGVKTGVYFWPGSEAAIGGVRPSLMVPYDGTVPNSARVDHVASWLRLPPPERPHLLLLYFSLVDDTTHRYGPSARQTAVAVSAVDAVLRRLLDSLAVLPIRDSVNVVLVSDHGMVDIPAGQVIPVGELLSRGGIDTTGIEMSDDGPVMSLWFGGDSARLERARGVLSASTTRARVYRRAESPARWHLRDSPRAGDLLLEADKGFLLTRVRPDSQPAMSGAHGYDPALPDMQGIFVAAGPNVRALGRIPAFENVGVYPFLAALLRLTSVPRVDGKLGTLSSALR